jgi:membrane protease YdiL (CAAX protease family)
VAPLGFALVLGAGYIALDVWQPAEPLLSILAFVPGLLGVAALTLAGFSREELRLQFRPLSRAGATALAVTTVLLLPILLSNSGFLGWRWLPALIWAPASGIAQELYFRGTLLPGLERAIGNRRWALLAHLPVFVLFHLRLYLALPSVPIALLCTLVLGAAGFSWGWQVQRDDTLVWAIAQHSVFLMLMSLFAFG